GGSVPPTADYHEHRTAAKGRRQFERATTWLELLDREHAFLVLSTRAFEEIGVVRFWVRDAIVYRWAVECAVVAKQLKPVPIDVFELELPERDPALVSRLKKLYAKLGIGSECLYTGVRLDAEWDLDHVLPMSKFPVNRFWNLAPSDPATNNE